MEKNIFSLSKMKRLLVFLTIVGFESTLGLELVEKTPFNGPGVYFDPVGKIKFLADHMEIVTYVNVKSTLQTVNSLLYSMNRAAIICYQTKVLDKTATCENTLNSLEKSLKDDMRQMGSVEEIGGSRQKRATRVLVKSTTRTFPYVNGLSRSLHSSQPPVGYKKYDIALKELTAERKKIVSTINGKIVAVTSDVESVQADLVKIKKTERELNSDLLDVVQFLFTEKKLSAENRDLLKNNSESIAELELKVDESQKIIDDYETIIGGHETFLKQNDARIQAANMKYKVNSLLFNLQIQSKEAFGKLKSILQGHASSKMGILHPNILTSEQVLDAFDKKLIPSNYELPAAPIKQNVETIMDLSKISSFSIEDWLVFVIKVPLVHKARHNAFSVVPLPVPVGDKNDMFLFVKPHQFRKYFALSADRSTYARLDSLDGCRQLSKDTVMCGIEKLFPTNAVPSCETKLMVNVLKKLPEECSVRYVHGTIDYWNRLNNNRWIFVQSDSTRLSLDCNERDTLDEIVVGSGILNIPMNCSAYVGLNKLVGDVRDAIDIQTPKILFELSKDDCCLRLDEFKRYLKPSALSTNDLEDFVSKSLPLSSNDLYQSVSKSHPLPSSDLKHFVSKSHPLSKDTVEDMSSVKIASYVIIGAFLMLVCAFILFKCTSRFTSTPNNS